MKGFQTNTEGTRGGPGPGQYEQYILGHYYDKIRAFPELDPL